MESWVNSRAQTVSDVHHVSDACPAQPTPNYTLRAVRKRDRDHGESGLGLCASPSSSGDPGLTSAASVGEFL